MRLPIGTVAAVAAWMSLNFAQSASGQWAEIPDTRLEQAKQANGAGLLLPPALPRGGENGTAVAIISAWNSAALDTDNGHLLQVRHGGHADTAHNGVLALDLATRRWIMLRDTSKAYPPIPGPTGTTYGPTYSDGTPASVHIYDCEEYLPSVKRVYSGGGIYWSPPGESVPAVVWWWNPATKDYERKRNRPGGYGCASVWDPISSRLILRTSGDWLSYDPTTDSYATLASKQANDSTTQSTPFLDATGRKVYRIERQDRGGGGGLRMLDLAQLGANEQTLLTEGNSEIETLAGVGGVFMSGQIVAFGRTADAKRGAVYAVSVAGCGTANRPRCRWTRYDAPSGLTPPPPEPNGMWKRVFVWGNALYVLPSAKENLWVLPLPWKTLVAAPPTSASTSPAPATNPAPGPSPSPAPSPAPSSAPPPASPPAKLPVAGTVESLKPAPPVPSPSPVPSPLPSPPPVASPPPVPSPPPPSPPPAPLAKAFSITVPVPGSDLSAHWNAIPLWASGQGPMTNPPGGKHARLIYDPQRKRMLLAGGDRDLSDAGNPEVWSFTAGGAAQRLSAMCRPYPDWLPSFPDNVTWVYDTKRDRALIMPGYFNDFSRTKAVCGRDDDRVLKRRDGAGAPVIQSNGLPYKEGGVFDLTANAWAPPTWPFPPQGYGGDQGSNFGVYDPTSDSVFRFLWDGNHGNNLHRLALTPNKWTLFPLYGSGDPERSRVANSAMTTSQPALDVVKRNLYGIGSSTFGVQQPNGTWKDVVEWRLLKVNVDTGAAERLALPSNFPPFNVGDGGVDILLTFDPKSRLLIHVNFPNLCGDVASVWISYVDDGHRWVQVPLPTAASASGPVPPLKGNVLGFDPDKGLAVLIGGHGCGLPNGTRTPQPTHYWTLSLTKG